VCSSPHRRAPPKLKIFRDDDLLEQGVVRPSTFPHASPTFLVPMSTAGFRLVVVYRKVNSKVVFDSYPMPTIEQAFGCAVVFYVSDLNSAYYQIPLRFGVVRLPSARHSLYINSTSCLWGVAWVVRC